MNKQRIFDISLNIQEENVVGTIQELIQMVIEMGDEVSMETFIEMDKRLKESGIVVKEITEVENDGK